MADYLVTGAAGGMGSAVCRSLESAGHRVWRIDRRFLESPLPPDCLEADVTDPESLVRAADVLRAKAVRLSGVVHAAGIYELDSLVEIPEKAFLRVFDVNLFGMYRLNRLLLPLLAENARVVIISSELAPLNPLPFTGVYAVTKAAVEKYAFSLQMELQLLGHQVVVIRPGAVRTGMLSASTAALDRFCGKTELYRVNAGRFRDVVNRVEAHSVPPEKIAGRVSRALSAHRPKPLYCVNRNPMLLALNLLPRRLQLRIIRRVVS